jgi:hypothetical protein
VPGVWFHATAGEPGLELGEVIEQVVGDSSHRPQRV